MPDSRRHRGPAPGDDGLFGAAALPALSAAVSELSWLLSRRYAEESALKLVGDRHSLRARQRKAVQRCASSDAASADRRRRRIGPDDLAGRAVELDGFNCLILCESALSGAPLFLGRDGALRDLASVHGTWRKIAETVTAVEAIGRVVAHAAEVRWLLDRPVSNSGKLSALILTTAEQHGWRWQVELADNPDRELAGSRAVVATADSFILDRCRSWIDLPAAVIAHERVDAWIVDLSAEPRSTPGP